MFRYKTPKKKAPIAFGNESSAILQTYAYDKYANKILLSMKAYLDKVMEIRDAYALICEEFSMYNKPGSADRGMATGGLKQLNQLVTYFSLLKAKILSLLEDYRREANRKSSKYKDFQKDITDVLTDVEEFGEEWYLTLKMIKTLMCHGVKQSAKSSGNTLFEIFANKLPDVCCDLSFDMINSINLS